ncbi:MAG: hypothetical protein IT379_02225 [Deltaproteobacteria bacterium]|nr:hypothetical protein [Deltaproteobacteria bacterium]
MPVTSSRAPAVIVAVAVALMAGISLRPLSRAPVITGNALACTSSDASTSDVGRVHAMADAMRHGSLLGPVDETPPLPEGSASSAARATTQEVPRCPDPLRLVAIAAAPGGARQEPFGAELPVSRSARDGTPTYGLAAIADGHGRASLHRIGEAVGQGLTLVEMGTRAVVLADPAGRACTLAMSRPAEQPSTSATRTTSHTRRRDPVPESVGTTRPPADATLPRGRGLRAALGRARVSPHVENGRTIGVRLVGVRTSAVLGALGFEDGDVIRAVNGYPVATPDEALRAYAALRDAPRLTVALDRAGAPMTLDFHVR